MIKIITDKIDDKENLEDYLHSKKRVCELVAKVDGSMLNFHKEVKTVQEMENIAMAFFNDKKRIKDIKSQNGGIREQNLLKKLETIKPIQSDDLDFI